MTRDYLEHHKRTSKKNSTASVGSSGAVPRRVRLICGLGNADARYAKTRHNIGFTVVDEVFDLLGCSFWKTQAGCMVASARVEDTDIYLAKPQDFMNTSGGPISKLAHALDIPTSEILIIHDEIDLLPTRVRLKYSGGLNAHNGLRSVSAKLQTKDFCRLQCGVGRPAGKMQVSDYVLQHLTGAALEDFLTTSHSAAVLCVRCLREGFQKTLESK